MSVVKAFKRWLSSDRTDASYVAAECDGAYAAITVCLGDLTTPTHAWIDLCEENEREAMIGTLDNLIAAVAEFQNMLRDATDG